MAVGTSLRRWAVVASAAQKLQYQQQLATAGQDDSLKDWTSPRVEWLDGGLPQLSQKVRDSIADKSCGDGANCHYCGRTGIRKPFLFNHIRQEEESSSFATGWKVEICSADHYDNGSISICHVTLRIWILGPYSKAEILAALLVDSGVERLDLRSPSSMPDGDSFMANFFPQFPIITVQNFGSHRLVSDGSGNANDETVPDRAVETQFSGLIDAVQNSSRLKMLHITDSSFPPGRFMHQFFHALARSPSLADICIQKCTFPDANDDDDDDDDGDSSVTTDSSLVDLTIQNCSMGPQAIGRLLGLSERAKNLEKMHISGISHLPVEAVKNVPNDSSENKADTTNLVSVIATLLECQNVKLKQLTLARLPSPLDGTPLAESLRRNETLEELLIPQNMLGGVSQLMDALETNHTLEKLDMSQCTFGDSSDDSRWSGLAKSNTLREINLSQLELSIVSSNNLFMNLGENSSLHTLHMTHLELDEGVSLGTLFNFLQTNTTLQDLKMDYNVLEKEAFDNLVSYAVATTTLKSLSLQGCGLTDSMLVALAARLVDVKSVSSMDLSFNEYGREGVSALLNCLPENHCIKEIRLYNSAWSTHGPINYGCQGYEEENKQIQTLIKNNANE
eukprot:scaffold5787_cov157-Amphora_coffeaeformis.AAC.12